MASTKDTFTKAERAAISLAFSVVSQSVQCWSTSGYTEWKAAARTYCHQESPAWHRAVMVQGFSEGCGVKDKPLTLGNLMTCDPSYRLAYMIGATLSGSVPGQRHIPADLEALAAGVAAACEAEKARWLASRA